MHVEDEFCQKVHYNAVFGAEKMMEMWVFESWDE
jgi:hypothetical protein